MPALRRKKLGRRGRTPAPATPRGPPTPR
jgi:hypothetical protein